MACSRFTPLGGSCSKVIIHFLLSHNGGLFDGQIVVIHGDQLLGGFWGTHEPGAHAPGIHPCDGEEVGFGGRGISGVKIAVGIEVDQIHLPVRQPLGPARTRFTIFQSLFSGGNL